MSEFVPYERRQPPKPVDLTRRAFHHVVEYGPPHEFRIQFLNNLEAVIGVRRPVNWTRAQGYGELVTSGTIWDHIVGAVSHEYGQQLRVDRYQDAREAFREWFLERERPMVHILTAMELALHVLSHASRQIASYQDEHRSSLTLDQAVADINVRLKQNHVDYYVDPESLMIRSIDSEMLNAEVVTPALSLVRQSGFASAEQDFNLALEHHRNDRQEEAIIRAGNAFENVLKQIIDERGWKRNETDTVQTLVRIVVLDKGLLPPWMDGQLTQLRVLLETGVPIVRNKMAGHGSGPTPRNVPPYLAAYAIHTAAANIVLLIEAHKANSSQSLSHHP